MKLTDEQRDQLDYEFCHGCVVIGGKVQVPIEAYDLVRKLLSSEQAWRERYKTLRNDYCAVNIAKDPVGALTVGECNFFIQKHGQYHVLLEKVEKLKQTIADLSEMEEEATKHADMAVESYDIGRMQGRALAYRNAIKMLSGLVE